MFEDQNQLILNSKQTQPIIHQNLYNSPGIEQKD